MSFTQTRDASRGFFPDMPTLESSPEQWLMRGANFIVAYAQAVSGERLDRVDNPDEYFVYLPDAPARIEAGSDAVEVEAGSLAIVPPGPSSVTLKGEGRVVRILSSHAADLAQAAANAAVYSDGAPEVAPAAPWPAPRDGYRVRAYRLTDYSNRPMRMFRSANLMVNVIEFPQPRDTSTLTPHSHADFEQGSLAMTGQWVHHLRYPWTPDMAKWRDDEHLEIGSPSLLVIPATVIHTSRSISDGPAQLVDIFSPPRADFVERGLVCNDAEYPHSWDMAE